MIRGLWGVLLALVLAACAAAPLGATGKGSYVEWTELEAEGLPAQRVTIWLPPEYDGETPLPVLYMWDGQNLFDPARTHYGKAWMVQDVLASMVAAGEAEAHIVVGIWSPPGRHRYRLYLPQFAAELAEGEVAADIARMAGGPIASRRQLDWVADHLKPRIDAHWKTRSTPPDTTIAGASMGGVMACYALIERPDVFGRAGCVSAHLALVDPALAPDHAAMISALWNTYLDRKLGRAAGRRIWLDHGTETLDAHYAPWQAMVAQGLAQRGWVEGTDFVARVYRGAEHDELSWHARLPEMLAWLWRADLPRVARGSR